LSGPFTLAGLAQNINNSNAGVRAAIIQVSPGSYRLKLTSTSTGTANDFSILGTRDAVLGLQSPTDGQDAIIQIGASSDVATSSSNTFTNVFPGVTFTASAASTNVSLTVADDTTAMAAQVTSLVTSLNTAISALTNATVYKASVNGSGTLGGESSLRSLAQALPASFVSTLGATGESIGLAIGKDGVVTFDSAVFASAMASDSSTTKSSIAALAKQLGGLAYDATKAATGIITRAVTDKQSNIESLSNKISDWDDKLAARQTLLTNIYAGINANLATLRSTSDWLSSQITALTAKTN
jgi:flagellar hook-associated protein 2